ncbi:uncharacterized protein LOC117167027 [Belonocnema kinseyi]|uniref:uncharacterized protein LOC117167027 n=1 Tax=Belonocnema kinseyi TaxID=2817044 RepID=UPI00143D0921|nr:uncharacterized protein LOC117167027 [Belonocnema kinseyi]
MFIEPVHQSRVRRARRAGTQCYSSCDWRSSQWWLCSTLVSELLPGFLAKPNHRMHSQAATKFHVDWLSFQVVEVFSNHLKIIKSNSKTEFCSNLLQLTKLLKNDVICNL